jgi:predicted RNA-binding Zn-ribbon protein involved in translation (DUF1610 family)
MIRVSDLGIHIPYHGALHGRWLNEPNEKYTQTGKFIPAFNLPAFTTRKDVYGQYWSKKFPLGYLVCKKAKACVEGCYARHGNYVNLPDPVKKAHLCLDFTTDPNFVSTIVWELKNDWGKRKHYKTRRWCRLHTSGEFYSVEYLASWLQIARLCPDWKFWVYTKMVSMFNGLGEGVIPKNFIVVFSEGGKEDARIDTKHDRFSRIFPRGTVMGKGLAKGFADCTVDDSVAIVRRGARKIGLRMHGGGKAFSTVPGLMPNPAGYERTTCPSCDEHVNLEHGQCPKCGAWVTTPAAKSPDRCGRCGRLLMRLIGTRDKCVGWACPKCGTAGR